MDEAAAPRTLTAAWEIKKLLKYNPLEDSFRRMAEEFKAVRAYPVNPYNDIKTFLYKVRLETQNISLRKNVILSEDPLSDGEIKEILMDEIDHRIRLDKDVGRTIKALGSLGELTEDQIWEAASEAQIGQRRLSDIWYGRTETPRSTHTGLRNRMYANYEKTKNNVFLYRLKLLDEIYSRFPQYYYHDEN